MPKQPHISACKKCGCKEFVINEGIVHKAAVDEAGILSVYKQNWTSEVEHIICKNCGEEYGEGDFMEVRF